MRRRPILRNPPGIKRGLYRVGYRPRPGSVLYSPSLALKYSGVGKALAAGMEAGLDVWRDLESSDAPEAEGRQPG